MKILFDIPPESAIGKRHTLLLEAGSEYCCYAYYDKAANKIEALRYLSFDEVDAEASLQTILEEASQPQPAVAVICSALPQALLIPHKFSEARDVFLETVYGKPFTMQAFDAIPEWQIANAYWLPVRLPDTLHSCFSSVEFFHAYTPAIKNYNGYAAGTQIAVCFTPQRFRVLFRKEAAVQLAQTYAYKTPLDVVYYLLKIGYEFGITQGEADLILSGLIEKDSAMFNELQHYFSKVHFAHPPDITLPDAAYPHHFFTSLYNLARCAS